MHHQHDQLLFQLAGQEAKRSATTFVGHFSGSIDQIQPIRQSTVGPIGLVIDAVDQQRNRDVERFAAFAGGSHAFGECFVSCHLDSELVITLHSPTVGGVCFLNVDGIKINLIAVLAVQLVDDSRLESKGASGEAAEDQDDRSFAF